MRALLTEQKGLTLIEILVAMTLLSLIILTSLTLLGNGIGVSDINDEKSQALNLAEQQIESWKNNLAQNGWDRSERLFNDPVTVSGKTFFVEVTAVEWDGSAAGLDAEMEFVNLTSKVWLKDESNPEAILKTLVKVDSGT